MKKWISLLTCIACTFSSVKADEAPPVPDETLAVTPELADDPATPPPEDNSRKQVGQAASDGSKKAGSGAGKYVLAACAIIVGIAALILVSRNSGHHKKHRSH
ncbi:MAG TPA: hypothetical protein VMR37_00765 [Rhabdochlamydiaceae bacterium]|nr:hypothetical protein [Rhabdochlamydiaceae bacterium]